MRLPVTILISGLMLSGALAQGRPDTTRLACAAAQRLVKQSGAIVLTTGRDLYDRFVDSEAFCNFDQVAKPAFVRSADKAQCFVGYTCERREYGDR
jgi:hypothetical protein